VGTGAGGGETTEPPHAAVANSAPANRHRSAKVVLRDMREF
jgi:hypothetical protein